MINTMVIHKISYDNILKPNGNGRKTKYFRKWLTFFKLSEFLVVFSMLEFCLPRFPPPDYLISTNLDTAVMRLKAEIVSWIIPVNPM